MPPSEPLSDSPQAAPRSVSIGALDPAGELNDDADPLSSGDGSEPAAQPSDAAEDAATAAPAAAPEPLDAPPISDRPSEPSDGPVSFPPPTSSGRAAALPPPISRFPASAGASHRPSRPLLASEALMEDLAPVEPLGQRARILCIGIGVLFALLGLLPLLGVEVRGQPALVPSLVVGAVTLFAAVTRVSYRKRAVAMVALGAIVAVLGIAGTGPAQGTAEGGAVWAIARWVAAAVVPAALLFRARYRAFEGARVLLGLAFLTALPFAIHAITLIREPNVFGLAQVGALLALALLIAGLPGFMGSETTAAGSYVAPAMIAALALQAGLQRLGATVPGSLADVFGVMQATPEEGALVEAAPSLLPSPAALSDAVVTAGAFAASALLAALGLFQILAWKFAPAARKIDVHRPSEVVIEDRPSTEDWSTRM
jgi:hypothetical protein